MGIFKSVTDGLGHGNISSTVTRLLRECPFGPSTKVNDLGSLIGCISKGLSENRSIGCHREGPLILHDSKSIDRKNLTSCAKSSRPFVIVLDGGNNARNS